MRATPTGGGAPFTATLSRGVARGRRGGESPRRRGKCQRHGANARTLDAIGEEQQEAFFDESHGAHHS